ncbi:ABC transporter ATP-binding protein [Paenibacillus sp. JSM ZJ436]|uniref:ABC transporter ATP-binding protein n=1 Tax=Paenibacillus sp. JSM ZJ436 TaxID=3376190 RepID=UPI0037A084D5
MSETAVLQLEQVSKVIKGQTLLQPLHLKLEAGRILALCGGNGAGKSTLLRLAAGLSSPSSGTVSVLGMNWKRQFKRCAASIGYMPDDFQFGEALTAYETLSFYASLRGAAPARVHELLERTGLREVKDRKVAAFSKGMRQRLLFAQALLAAPPLLILDEPTNGLDPYWMNAFAELVSQCASEGQSVIFSTHQLNVAEQSADEVIFLDAGHVRYQGAAAPLKEQYAQQGGLYGAFADLVMSKAGSSRPAAAP